MKTVVAVLGAASVLGLALLWSTIPGDLEPPPHATLRKEWVRCGKKNCDKCSRGLRGHGPYVYAYWKDTKTGALRKKYVGR